MKPKRLERAALTLFVLYCIDLAWKLRNWSELTRGLAIWMVVLALTIRFAVMFALLRLFLWAKQKANAEKLKL
jgi:hypothetical protein